MTIPGSTYSPGGWYALVSPSTVVFVDPTLPGAQLDALWDGVLAGRGADESLAVITAADRGRLPQFAVASVEGGRVRVAVRGTVQITVQDVDGLERGISGAGVEPWREELVERVETLWFVRSGGGRDGLALPVVCAAVTADIVAWQPEGVSRRREDPASGAVQGTRQSTGEPAVQPAPPPAVQPTMPPAGSPAVPATAPPIVAPVGRLGLLYFSTGEVVDVDRPVIIGRAPAAQDGENARLVSVKGSGRGISRTHVRVDLDEHGAVARDLGSRNGTVVRSASGESVALEPGVPYRLHDGQLVALADVSFEFRALPDGG